MYSKAGHLYDVGESDPTGRVRVTHRSRRTVSIGSVSIVGREFETGLENKLLSCKGGSRSSEIEKIRELSSFLDLAGLQKNDNFDGDYEGLLLMHFMPA